MKKFVIFLLFLISISTLYAHEGDSCSSPKASFKDYNYTIKLLTQARDRLGKSGPNRIAVYTADGRNMYFNTDAFAELFRQAIYLYKIDLDDTKKLAALKHFSCSSHDHDHDHDPEIEPGRFRKFIQYLQTFGIETTAQTFEIASQHGLPFAAYFIITETLEHILFTPFLGVPICKFLQGAYLFLATPVRNFLGVGLNSMGGYAQIPAHMVQAFQSFVYSGRFKKRMKTLLIDTKGSSRLYAERAQYEKVAENSKHFMERYLSKNVFWAEAFTGFYLAEEDKVKAFQLDNSYGLHGDFNFISNIKTKKELRHDRVERMIHGFRTLKDLQTKHYEAAYFQGSNKISFMEYIKFRSFIGKFNGTIDVLRDALITIATTENKEALENIKPFIHEYQGITEEILWLFEDMAQLTILKTKSSRKYYLSELKKNAKNILKKLSTVTGKTRNPSRYCNQLLANA